MTHRQSGIFNTFDDILNDNIKALNANKRSLTAGKQVKLRCTTDKNNNKFYNMTEKNDGTFEVEYGRIGAPNPRHVQYPMSRWDKIYQQKIDNGYRDVTSLYVVNTSASNGATLSSSPFDAIIRKLQSFTKQVVDKNYKVSPEEVTESMLNEAQKILDDLAQKDPTNISPADLGQWITDFNNELLHLFEILPRKMTKVTDYLMDKNSLLRTYYAYDSSGRSYVANHDYNKDVHHKADRILYEEQQILDTITTLFKKNHSNASFTSNPNAPTTLLQQLGIEMKMKDSALESQVMNLLGPVASQYSNCWYVTNLKTQARFDAHISALKGTHKKVDQLWHGSRNENWLSIISTGLEIRPAGRITTGAMFGYGIYFANQARKSLGYTSSKGSYWAHGNSSVAYLALFNVNVGKMLRLSRHLSECYSYNKSVIQAKGDYDSVYAQAGQSLRNDEFIIYDPAQCTIYALVELKA